MKKASGMPWRGRAYLHKKYPWAFPLSESQLEVLDGLARNGPINPYKLGKSIRKAYSFVFNTLRELELRKMVTFLREKTEKGVYAKIYDLALEGVMLVLHREMNKGAREKKNLSFIRKIIEKYSHMLPLVFGKWRYFEKAGCAEMVLTRLKIIVDTHESNPFKKGTGFYPWLEMEQQITRFFFFFDTFKPDHQRIIDSDYNAWMTALRQDKEIKSYVIQELKYEQKRLKNVQIQVEKSILFMEPHPSVELPQ